MDFEWDDAKDRANQSKHGLSFADVVSMLAGDEDYLEIFDSAHSDVEDRFIAVGEIDRGVAVVVYTVRDESTVRIIGARLATRKERGMYREYKGKKG